MKERVKKKPTAIQALFPIVFMFVILAVGYGVMGLKTEFLIILAGLVAGLLAYSLGYGWQELSAAIVQKIADCLPATLI